MSEHKQTPLFPIYAKYGGKTIDFGGWDLPVQFTSIKDEHLAVRNEVGLFDVSHMGEIEISGEKSVAFLQHLLTNNIEKLAIGRAQYTIMCYPDGGTVDDLVVYRLAEDKFLAVVNAANISKDWEWMIGNNGIGAELKNRSGEISQLALQGPKAAELLQKEVSIDIAKIPFFGFQKNVELFGCQVLLSKSGYTGEDGFEIYLNNEDAISVWEALVAKGAKPIGLGARDTLRLEAVLALYGQELSQNISPLEAGLSFAVKLQKEADFIGKEALIKQKNDGLKRKSVGIEMIDRGIARHGYPVYDADGEKEIGEITSGGPSPSLDKNIALALIESDYAQEGEELVIGIRAKKLKAKIIPTPFYKRSK